MVPGSECLGESLHTSGDRVWAGASYPAQVLSLKPQSAALYLHAVSSYLPLYHLGQQQAAKDFKVPAIGDNVVQVVMRIVTGRDQHRLRLCFEIHHHRYALA